MVYLGYYSDPACHESIHYTPFSRRGKSIPPPHHIDLNVLLPEDITSPTLEADVCIVGSGAAGSTLAYELAKQGRSILIVEKGEYVQPKDFNENEVEMIGKLYADGVYQQTEDFKFTIIQGNCVGGSTVVNNAVSFSLPESVFAKWNDPNGYDARLVGEEIRKSDDAIRHFLSIQPQSKLSSLNPSYHEVDAGMAKYDPDQQRLQYDVVNANVNSKGCVGCGYCNIGCKFGMKLSMLDHTLPIAQKEFPDQVRILAECAVDRVSTMTGKVKRAHSLDATLRGGRRIVIKANTIILSAGTIASSYILKSSGLARHLPVGKGICFNMGTPIYAKFNRSIKATEGLQISHFLKPTTDKGYVFETWWNPPVSQAINMPGWFGDHFDNMIHYDKIMAVGILVGTRSEGKLVNAATGGAGVIFKPGKEDRQKMGMAIKEMGEILFKAGAEKVMLNTWSYHSFNNLDELIRVVDELVQKPDELALGSGHPQGGNAISSNPKLGVVDENFKVHGYSNLYVCDASVFPTSLTVNPQLTVMTLAHYASTRIK